MSNNVVEKPEKCELCAECAVIPTEYGIVRRCKKYKILLEEKYVEEKRPSWCRA